MMNLGRRVYLVLTIVALLASCSFLSGQALQSSYLDSIKADLQVRWPKNKTIKLVFHGHSVPAGYFRNGQVKSLDSYPYLTLKKLNEIYPYAVISPLVTAIGGEQSAQGAERFSAEVLSLQPDVLFIDYSLNDRSIGLDKARQSWEAMIESALEKNISVILLTPTPDLNEDILKEDTPLALHSEQVRALASKYNVGLVDSYAAFRALAEVQSIDSYMSQNNHVNGLGHDVVANEIVKWFLE